MSREAEKGSTTERHTESNRNAVSGGRASLFFFWGPTGSVCRLRHRPLSRARTHHFYALPTSRSPHALSNLIGAFGKEREREKTHFDWSQTENPLGA